MQSSVLLARQDQLHEDFGMVEMWFKISGHGRVEIKPWDVEMF